MRALDGIELCVTHYGICVEGTDYTGEPDSLGCEYAECESDEPCELVGLWFEHPSEGVK